MNITIPKIPERTITLPKKSELLKGLLLICLARVEFFGLRPFGIALGATFPPTASYIAAIGLIAGTMDSYMLPLKYILSLLIYYILNHFKENRGTVERSATLALSVATSGVFGFLWTGISTSAALLLIVDALCAGGANYLFSKSMERTNEGNLAKLIILGGVLNVFSSVFLPYININAGVFTAVLICASFSYSLLGAESALAAGIIGFLMYISNGAAPAYAGIYALSAFLAASLSGFGKFGVAIGFLSGMTVGALYRGALPETEALAIFFALFLFVVCPERLHFKISEMINERAGYESGESEAKSYIAKRLKVVARAVSNFADGITYHENPQNNEQNGIFSLIAPRVCAGCSLFESCAGSGQIKENINLLLKAMDEDGFVACENMPRVFHQACMRPESFLTEFCHIYELNRQDKLMRGEMVAGCGAVARQYDEISGVIDMISEEIMAEKISTEEKSLRYSVEVGMRQEAKNGEKVSGDSILHFGCENKYYVMLSDGMGTGACAKAESELVTKLFSELLPAGFSKTQATKMINSALSLNSGRESFSTVDVLEIDLSNGNCELLKVGGSDSFHKNKDGVSVFSSSAMPIGILENTEVNNEHFMAKNGDLIVLVSDGIGEAASGVLKSDWIKKIIEASKDSPDALCEKIIKGAKNKSKFPDDMSCVVVKIKKHKE